ncbi:hypothetical protein HMPREF9555_01590 [Selenomonas artemidis F0399]|uniref:Uncharacterized protein n=1 Tax=Selenomonas artemidis F0399 TaxID=749551 RepID=E7N3K0_9FIRM|nr:hypothetical protein HMPREF9555_01590 [Selenomonas artemidis F0399]
MLLSPICRIKTRQFLNMNNIHLCRIKYFTATVNENPSHKI